MAYNFLVSESASSQKLFASNIHFKIQSPTPNVIEPIICTNKLIGLI